LGESLSSLMYLLLNRNQLTGSIPAQLGDITNLYRLELDYNQLTGSIPIQLGNPSTLRFINLASNQLSGTIPVEFGSLSNLLTLNLARNQLTGPIPAVLGNLPLTQLGLGSNQFTGSIPVELGNLSSLTSLSLDNNQLTGSVPSELGALTNLTYLYLSFNQLSGTIPPDLGSLSSLTRLLLGGNQLTGPIPTQLANLTNLVDSRSDFRWSALYTSDSGLETFLSAKQLGGDWQSTQTIAPANFAAGSPTETSIGLIWDPILYQGDFGGYEHYYATVPGGPYTLFGTTDGKAAPGATITGLSPDTTYYFQVRTLTPSHTNNPNDVYSEYTNEITASTSTIEKSPPVPPTADDPADESIIVEGSEVTLDTSEYNDPDGDDHTETRWEVWRVDTGVLLNGYPLVVTPQDPSMTLHEITETLWAGLKYVWRVTYLDSDGNSSRSREYSFKIGESETEILPYIMKGTDVGDFGMISIVHLPDDPSPEAVFHIEYDPRYYRIGTYDAINNRYIEFDEGLEMEPGKSYWILAREGLVVYFDGIPVSMADVYVALDYNTNTGNGWNMVAPPNGADYYWGDVRVVEVTDGALLDRGAVRDLPDVNDYIDRKLWRWENGDYVAGDLNTDSSLEMAAYKGYWVQAKQENVLLLFGESAQARVIASLGTPETLVAKAWCKTKTWLSNLDIFSQEAVAVDNDTPPMPMGVLDNNNVDPVFQGCFIEITESF